MINLVDLIETAAKKVAENKGGNQNYMRVKMYNFIQNIPDIPLTGIGFIPYLLKNNNSLAQCSALIKIRNTHNIKHFYYIGMASLEKEGLQHLDVCKINEKIALNSDWQVYSLTKTTEKKENIYSPGKLLVKKIGQDFLKEMAERKIIKAETVNKWDSSISEKFILNNRWILRRDTFINYIDTFLIPTMRLIREKNKDSYIFKTSKAIPNTSLSTKTKENSAINFILKRLINIYILDRGVVQTNLLK